MDGDEDKDRGLAPTSIQSWGSQNRCYRESVSNVLRFPGFPRKTGHSDGVSHDLEKWSNSQVPSLSSVNSFMVLSLVSSSVKWRH